jgi:hypothetical protein
MENHGLGEAENIEYMAYTYWLFCHPLLPTPTGPGNCARCRHNRSFDGPCENVQVEHAALQFLPAPLQRRHRALRTEMRLNMEAKSERAWRGPVSVREHPWTRQVTEWLVGASPGRRQRRLTRAGNRCWPLYLQAFVSFTPYACLALRTHPSCLHGYNVRFVKFAESWAHRCAGMHRFQDTCSQCAIGKGDVFGTNGVGIVTNWIYLTLYTGNKTGDAHDSDTEALPCIVCQPISALYVLCSSLAPLTSLTSLRIEGSHSGIAKQCSNSHAHEPNIHPSTVARESQTNMHRLKPPYTRNTEGA